MQMPDQPWPVVPRPFPDEAFGSWFGRIAALYRIGVDELARAGRVRLDFGEQASSWLAGVPRPDAYERLSYLCRMPSSQIEAMPPTQPLSERSRFPYCPRCLCWEDEKLQ